MYNYKKILSQKNLIIIVIVALCIIISCATVSTFASYSHEVKAVGTASPRGGYVLSGNNFEFIDKTVSQDSSYNFFLTNVNSDNITYDKNINVEFTMTFDNEFFAAISMMQVSMNSDGAWSDIQHEFSGQVVTFKDSTGFKSSQPKINYYKINFTLNKAIELKKEKSFFKIEYVTGSVTDSNIDDSPEKRIEMDNMGSAHLIYLGKIKDTLVNKNDFSIKVADIPKNALIVNVYYYGTLVDTLNVTSVVTGDAITVNKPYLVYAGAGYVPLPNSLTAGYTIVVYRPEVLPKGIFLLEG